MAEQNGTHIRTASDLSGLLDLLDLAQLIVLAYRLSSLCIGFCMQGLAKLGNLSYPLQHGAFHAGEVEGGKAIRGCAAGWINGGIVCQKACLGLGEAWVSDTWRLLHI